jgi:hypothetical protein
VPRAIFYYHGSALTASRRQHQVVAAGATSEVACREQSSCSPYSSPGILLSSDSHGRQ